MAAPTPDRSDPAVRARRQLERFERDERGARILVAVVLVTLAAIGPLVAEPIAGDPGATWGAIVASLFLVGCSVAIWPWAWSQAERDHHRLAAIWAEARPDAADPTPWSCHAAWAQADGERVDLLHITRAGSADDGFLRGSFSEVVSRSLDADAIAAAATAMEALREHAAREEQEARDRHHGQLAAAARKPLDDALREIDETAETDKRRAEEQMRAELAQQDAAERRAQAEAIARALRRP
jgi:hypothetical protein